MKDFVFVFRMDYGAMPVGTPEEMQAMTKKWMDWIGNIAAQGNLADRGNRLHSTGKVVRGNDIITNGPYTEIKESIGGYSVIKAESYEAAIELAKECPALASGGSVEIREISAM